MRYPMFIKKANRGIAVVCGCLVVVIAILTFYEMIARGLFNSPTTWTLNFSTYILIWYAFMGSGYSFQAHGHVGVDLFKDLVDRKGGDKQTARRVMSIIGYICSLLYIVVLLIGGITLCKKSIQFHQMTATLQPIPMIILNLAVVAGSIWMIITIIGILIDLFGGGKEYL